MLRSNLGLIEIEPGFDDKKAAGKGDDHREDDGLRWPFTQKKQREDRHEERGEPGQHGGIGQNQMVDGIEVTQHAGNAEERAKEKGPLVFPSAEQRPSRPPGHCPCNHQRDEIPHDDFLDHRNIRRRLGEGTHARKGQCRDGHEDDCSLLSGHG
jgi:hypothetical protein